MTKGGTVLFKCRAGCSQDAVLGALKVRGLWSPKSKSTTGRELPLPDEIEDRRHAARRRAAAEAKRRWKDAELASESHPYCNGKGVRPGALREESWGGGAKPLLIPMRDGKGKLVNLQIIHGDGKKHSIKGGQHKDTHYWIAAPEKVESKTICIAEGWATGRSARDATRHSTIVTFGKSNLLSVTRWVRQKYPNHKVIVLADDDGGNGVAMANEAARAVDGLVATPEFGKDRNGGHKDFNDLAQIAGLDEVKRQIDDAREPEDEEKKSGDKAKDTQALTLMNLPSMALFRADDHAGYADFIVKGHRETHRIKSTNFKRWLMHQYWLNTGQTASSEAVRQAIEMIEAKALFDADVPVREVFVRVGSHQGGVYIDLCDDEWRAIEVTQIGWRVVSDPPVRFRRARGMQSLPEPQRGGSVEELRSFVNVRSEGEEPTISDKDFVLVVAWLLAAYRDGPFPILKVWGEPGAAKSTMTEVLRGLVDPQRATRRRFPKEDRDLFIAANNAWVLSYDNVSAIPEWLSNSLCTIATGGGFAARALYTDEDEQLFVAKRPVIINAVENFVTKHDLANRMILLELPFIPASERQREKEFKEKFEAKRPRILGALLDVVAQGLKSFPSVPEEDWPRMADFAHWITACEPALWEPGTFRKAYDINRKKATQSAIDDDLVATALRGFVSQNKSEWSGTQAKLLECLTKFVGEEQAKGKDWPQNPRALTSRLEKARGALRLIGITIRSGRRTNRGRLVTIKPNLDDMHRSGKDRHNCHDRHLRGDHKGISRDGARDDRPATQSAFARAHKDRHDTDTQLAGSNYMKKQGKGRS
ncbi:toprim domain-containing protein [Bradyrhizobium sp. BR 1433]|uniref:toprim domain-containing protein n=1 Tax=Bradyrhizobium sp. BR 1433 TaxID=3447967 RepID=UPI003EE60B0F